MFLCCFFSACFLTLTERWQRQSCVFEIFGVKMYKNNYYFMESFTRKSFHKSCWINPSVKKKKMSECKEKWGVTLDALAVLVSNTTNAHILVRKKIRAYSRPRVKSWSREINATTPLISTGSGFYHLSACTPQLFLSSILFFSSDKRAQKDCWFTVLSIVQVSFDTLRLWFCIRMC